MQGDRLNIEHGQVLRRDAGERREPLPPTTSALAVGHSARDTFRDARRRAAGIEPKPFSITAFRIEHPQSLIDRARYGKFAGSALLGAADYKLVHHCGNGRSVYQLLHVPGRHGRGRRFRARPRGDEWDEPGLAHSNATPMQASWSGMTPAPIFRDTRWRASSPTSMGKPLVRSRWPQLLRPPNWLGDYPIAQRASTTRWA